MKKKSGLGKQQRRIARHLANGATTVHNIMSALDLNELTVRQAIRGLRARQLVEAHRITTRRPNGEEIESRLFFQLTNAGRAVVAALPPEALC